MSGFITEESERLQEAVAEIDKGSRHLTGKAKGSIAFVAVAWALFQLWYSSPLPFVFNIGIFNDTQARAIHLAFALFLAYTAYPALTSSLHNRIPIHDWLFALVGACCSAYLFVFYQELATRPGSPTLTDISVAVIGMLLLLEATRRALGPPLMIVAALFLIYVFWGPYMPSVISHPGASLSKAASHLWLSTEGVFGIALGVSTSFVFLFVLFGALLEGAGAGNYFIKIAFSLLGSYRGGPAKAAVLASGMTGLISGSSIANVVTTGTFTIPLMKRMGLASEKAGAVEVAASSYGQIMPPIMGAAAFLMVEYVDLPYIQIIKHAFVPAVAAYITLLYIMHLEALKANLQGIPRATPVSPFKIRLLRIGIITASLFILVAVVYHGLVLLTALTGDTAQWFILGGMIIAYLALLAYSTRFPKLTIDDPKKPITQLAPLGPTVASGLHFLLPVITLVWCLMVERLSPGLSAFYAVALMMGILVTQQPLLLFFRKKQISFQALKIGFIELIHCLETGSKNMIGIGVATAAAGIIVGSVTLTGLGPVMTEFVHWLSAGHLMLMLLLVAFVSLILGMGLPTTANYIVVSSLMAPVVVALSADHGLVVPLIAVHLFVFYFGIMADVTPPVGLASFAASAISGADPIKTGVQAFVYAMLTAVLPFMFIFNPEIILVGIDSLWHSLFIFIKVLIAMCLFASAAQGFLLIKSQSWERLVLLLAAFTLVRPDAWLNLYQDAFIEYPADLMMEVVESTPANEHLRMAVNYVTLSGEERQKIVVIALPEGTDGMQRLADTGIAFKADSNNTVIDRITFASDAEKAGLTFGQTIVNVYQPNERIAKEWFYLMGITLMLIVGLSQRNRQATLVTSAT